MNRSLSEAKTLHFDDVYKRYRGNKFFANDGISLEFQPGELVALIGHNGAGKTTLLNQAMGITRPSSGDVLYGSTSIVKNTDRARELISMMPQMYAPLTGVSPAQAVSAVARIRGLNASAASRTMTDLMSALDIDQWKDSTGEKLSGGLRRLTSYAMAVIAPPPVLLIDEPTNDVDPVRRTLVWKHLRSLADSGHIVVVVTHNLLEVEQASDRFVIFQQGKVLEDSSPSDLFRRDVEAFLTISPSSHVDVGQLPPCSSTGTLRDGRLRLSLTFDQMQTAVQWVVNQMRAGSVHTYSISPSSLETHYEILTEESREVAHESS